MKLPDPVPIDDDVLAAIAARHGLHTAVMWREVGRDLARLHTIRYAAPNIELSDGFAFADPRDLVDQRAQDSWISAVEARWLTRWLDSFADTGSAAATTCLVHGDVQLSNVLVAERSYQALIDWGCARTDDPAVDFLAMPLAAVPHLVATSPDGPRGPAPRGRTRDDMGRKAGRLADRSPSVLPRTPGLRTVASTGTTGFADSSRDWPTTIHVEHTVDH